MNPGERPSNSSAAADPDHAGQNAADRATVVGRVLLAWSEVPRFEDETQEAVFWAGTRIDNRLMNGAVLKADTRESATVTLRMDPRMLARLKRLARSRYLNYQSMVKQWLSERLEKEV